MWNTILCNVFLRNMRIAKASDPETSLGRRATHASLSEAEKYLAAKGQNAYMELAVKANVQKRYNAVCRTNATFSL